MIENYSFGTMVINGKSYTSDLLISSSSGIHPSWWRKQGHRVEVEDIEAVLDDNTTQVLLGQGQPGRMIASDRLKTYLAARKIQLIEEPTPTAIKRVNALLDTDEAFVAGFHLTC
ncbi:MAG: hypothetical protein GY737_11065 [Desulfobacteraceae bacterium]|nr:hypothetical protein [Desulfobacteraceae bacterium]